MTDVGPFPGDESAQPKSGAFPAVNDLRESLEKLNALSTKLDTFLTELRTGQIVLNGTAKIFGLPVTFEMKLKK